MAWEAYKNALLVSVYYTEAPFESNKKYSDLSFAVFW